MKIKLKINVKHDVKEHRGKPKGHWSFAAFPRSFFGFLFRMPCIFRTSKTSKFLFMRICAGLLAEHNCINNFFGKAFSPKLPKHWSKNDRFRSKFGILAFSFVLFFPYKWSENTWPIFYVYSTSI